ncbi:hypothetical protein M409DRAFT_70255 [Zasmidium cellare ATCC 36951]|uniref:FAD-binding domain-containing protein n=1 Tax=Zasmidium cellare ATCC 36951 TaxID=1080233 RepID=A0A6A6C1I3_ZASCE|nr:uncharacterized protein M409DRAFT_70255 [Zasmidium cellare ATCC 36951]KAF2160723.1 hypothetical protein M409DRAFT_70255 [Zasmidium cellare ATCC 36951]
MSPKVLIIGGGVGGLALAHGCKKHNIPFHVYERDRTEAYRAQGYRVRISGLAGTALQHLLTEQLYADFELSCADNRAADIAEIDAETGRVDLPKVDDSVRAKLDCNPSGWCVDRSAFRNVLIKALDKDEISYDKVFERYELSEDGVVAHFADGSQASGTLLVGADGKNSNVRKQLLPQVELLDTGVKCIYGKTLITPEILNTLPATAAKSMSFVKDRSQENLAILGLEPITFPNRETLEQRGIGCPPDYLFWALTGPSESLGFGSAEKRYLSIDESEQAALSVTQHWDARLRTIIQHQAPGETSAFSLTAISSTLPVWTPNAHITVLGDAIHPMAPTGSGAVMALNDASMLCEELCEHGVGEKAVGAYEERMRSVSGEAVKMSWAVVTRLAGMRRSNEMHLGEMAMSIRARNAERKA